VLIIGLVGRRPHLQEAGGIARRVGAIVGVVVGNFVVVPDRQPRRGGVGGLQVAIELVQRVAVAEFRQRRRDADFVPAHESRSPGLLVDVVAEMDDEIEVARRHVAIGREIALLVLLARGEGEAQPLRGAGGGGRGAGAAGRTLGGAGTEPVPVGTPRLEAAHVRMNRMGEGRNGLFGASRDDPGEGFVLGDQPVDRDRCVRHAAPFERLRCEARPQNDAVFARRARGDAQGEGIAGEARRCRARDREGGCEQRTPQRPCQEAAAGKTPVRAHLADLRCAVRDTALGTGANMH